jgi:hypothetical protein
MQWTSCPQQQTQEKRVKIKKGTLRRLRGGIRFESGREASTGGVRKIICCSNDLKCYYCYQAINGEENVSVIHLQ